MIDAEDRARYRRRALEMMGAMPEDDTACRYIISCMYELLDGYMAPPKPARLVDVKAMRAKKGRGGSHA
jgi:hypothetical protein